MGVKKKGHILQGEKCIVLEYVLSRGGLNDTIIKLLLFSQNPELQTNFSTLNTPKIVLYNNNALCDGSRMLQIQTR